MGAAVIRAREKSGVRVLVVEDSPADSRLVVEMLGRKSKPGFEVTVASRAAEMRRALERAAFDIVLLDLSLPDARDLEALDLVRGIASAPPVVILTGLDDEKAALRATRLGAKDYIVKGTLEPAALVRVIRQAIERHARTLDLERERDREHFLATHDPLTGLPGRRLFQELLAHAVSLARRHELTAALLFVDLDRFKAVNDAAGHAVGDQILVHAGARLRGLLRASDVAPRVGGDEFVLLLPTIRTRDDAGDVARRIVASLAAPFEVEGRSYSLGASVGIAVFPLDAEVPAELVRAADEAMLHAKELGRGRHVFASDRLRAVGGRDSARNSESTFPAPGSTRRSSTSSCRISRSCATSSIDARTTSSGGWQAGVPRTARG
jgi:diguanylate cyclase (GGDEF)-like protein